MIDLDAIRARHLRPEQMEHRTFYAGHIVIDLADLCDEVERLRANAVGVAFHDLAVTDLNAERVRNTALRLENERLRENAEARERFLRREGDLLRAAERERDELRREVADLRMLRDEHMIDTEHAHAEGIAQGTAAVVAYLRAAANAPHPSELGAPMLSPSGRGLLLLHADFIERGEHREEGP
jgi:hypothetical protein